MIGKYSRALTVTGLAKTVSKGDVKKAKAPEAFGIEMKNEIEFIRGKKKNYFFKFKYLYNN
jgi:hypothetical protein